MRRRLSPSSCSCVTFTHASQAVVYASKVKAPSKDVKKDHALRYHSLHDNTYLRYFFGHTAQVTTVSMSAKTDMFLSAAADEVDSAAAHMEELVRRYEGEMGLTPACRTDAPSTTSDARQWNAAALRA